MYLKSIELQGFKSFAEKTKLDFSAGVTGIVGPNGCGKSNVVDAVRWVLGETSARALRGDEMADVIFSGTDKRKPVGAAEVTLTMADCEAALGVEFHEVAITRRVSRDGKGSYFINAARCRLRDIQELFADTGIGRSSYSIMAQGQIDQILSSKPEERRAVFEEAAGITRFKRQKKEALRKLEHTDGNLLRVSDIIAEVSRQKNSLQRQATKAKKYQLFRNELRLFEGHHFYQQWSLLAKEELEQKKQVTELTQTISEQREAVEVREQGVRAQRESLAAIEEERNSLRTELATGKQQIENLQQRIEIYQERQVELTEGVHLANEECEQAGISLAKQQQELQALDKAIAALEASLVRQRDAVLPEEQAVVELKERKALLGKEMGQQRQRLQNFTSQCAALTARTEQQKKQLVELQPRIERLATEEKTIAEQKASVFHLFGELEQQEKQASAFLEQATQELENLEELVRASRAQVKQTTAEVEQLQRQAAEKESRLSVLKELLASGEGLGTGVQALLDGSLLKHSSCQQNGVYGTLAEHIQVKDKRYTKAIEAALGASLQAVVLADEALLEEVAQLLLEQQLGQTRCFLGQEKRVEKKVVETLPQGALALVSYEKNVAHVVESLLAGVVVVDDLSQALALQNQQDKSESSRQYGVVTLDGYWLAATGILVSAASKKKVSLLQRQEEVRELEQEVQRQKEQLSHAQAQLEYDKKQRDLKQQKKEEAQIQTQEKKGSLLAIQSSLMSTKRELQAMEDRLENFHWEQEQFVLRKKETEQLLDVGEQEFKQVEQQAQQAQLVLTKHEAKLVEFAEKEELAVTNLVQKRTELAVEEENFQSLQLQRSPLSSRVEELERLIVRRRKEVEASKQRIEKALQETEKMQEKQQQTQLHLVEVEKKYEQSALQKRNRQQQLADVQQEFTNLQQELVQMETQAGEVRILLTQLELKLDNLEQLARERYQLRLTQFSPQWELVAAVLSGSMEAPLEAPSLDENIEQNKTAFNEEIEISGEKGAKAEAAEREKEEVVEESQTEVGSVTEETVEHVAFAGNLASATTVAPEDFPWHELSEKVEFLRRKLEGMGPVNLEAIADFDELLERYEFLQNQQQDLLCSKELLLETIAKINEDSCQRFLSAFEQIRKNFRTIFSELFGFGAQSNLALLDPEDPLESGIEVNAKPPGKKLQSISLLSGGERSMTAVALLFAIYQVKPSPFCILDELDAPLDDSNIGRFVQMLDRFTSQSQFIVVTHSKRTMEKCDVLYGVTMEEQGVSKPIGMRLADAEKQVP